MTQFYAEGEKENSKIYQLLLTLENKEKEIADSQRIIMNIKQYTTDLQVFLSLKKIEEDVHCKNKFLQSLGEDKKFNQTSLSYKVNISIQNIISDVRSFGEVCTEAKSCDIVLIRKKAKQAQMMVPTVKSRSIENITLREKKTFNTQGGNITRMLPDGRIALTYYTEFKVIVPNTKGSKDFEVKMPYYPFDIVNISEDNTFAVTSGASMKNCITIIDLEKKQIKKIISLDSYSYGIALKDNQLIYSGDDKGIRIINIDNESISDIVRDKIPNHCYISTYRDNIYHTNNTTNTVTSYNLQGEIQWSFRYENVLNCPRGIDVDSDGNVYVAGSKSNNVVVIAHDGKRHREVLTASDGLNDPASLHYSGPQKQLLIANFRKMAHLFSIN